MGCKSTTTQQEHDFTIVGRVTDIKTGLGIEYVNVRLIRLKATHPKARTLTDANGDYILKFRIIYASGYRIEAFKGGYYAGPNNGRALESFEDTEETQTIDFKLWPY